MSFFTKKTEPLLDLDGFLTKLKRTHTENPFSVLFPQTTNTHVFVDLKAFAFRELARDWGDLADNLAKYGPPVETQDQSTSGTIPKTVFWVRLVADALATLTKEEQEELGVSATYLDGLLNWDRCLRAIHEQAGLAKDGAMDLRALTGAFGWFQLCTVMDHLREEVGKEGYTQALRDFTPMLTVISELKQEKSDRRETLQSAKEAAKDEVEDLLARAELAELKLARARGDKVDDEDLLKVAIAEAKGKNAPTETSIRPPSRRRRR